MGGEVVHEVVDGWQREAQCDLEPHRPCELAWSQPSCWKVWGDLPLSQNNLLSKVFLGYYET